MHVPLDQRHSGESEFSQQKYAERANFSSPQVSHIASCISLPLAQVEKKLSQMILDKKLRGVLDQGEGVLIVFEDTPRDKTYEIALDTIHSMGKVVDTLYQKAKKLT